MPKGKVWNSKATELLNQKDKHHKKSHLYGMAAFKCFCRSKKFRIRSQTDEIIIIFHSLRIVDSPSSCRPKDLQNKKLSSFLRFFNLDWHFSVSVLIHQTTLFPFAADFYLLRFFNSFHPLRAQSYLNLFFFFSLTANAVFICFDFYLVLSFGLVFMTEWSFPAFFDFVEDMPVVFFL